MKIFKVELAAAVQVAASSPEEAADLAVRSARQTRGVLYVSYLEEYKHAYPPAWQPAPEPAPPTPKEQADSLRSTMLGTPRPPAEPQEPDLTDEMPF